MLCDNCKREDAAATFGGFGFPDHQSWCDECADAAGIQIPTTLRYFNDRPLNEITQEKVAAYEAKRERKEVRAKTAIPFDTLEAGDVLIIRLDEGEDMKRLTTRVRNALWHFGQTTGYTLRKHKTKTLPDEQCIKVWRMR